MRVYAVGVGPGSPSYVSREAAGIIGRCGVVVGYEYTLGTVAHLLKDKEVYTVTMSNQEAVYQRVYAMGRDAAVVFTGDSTFLESEVVDRLAEIFGGGNLSVVPGISSVQVAAARSGVPLDKSRVIAFHVTGPIEEKKLDLLRSVVDGFNVIIVLRPWPSVPEKNFMPSEISRFLRARGIDTSALWVHVFESLGTDNEGWFRGVASDLEGREFSPLSVLVIDQNGGLDSYMNYKWQWECVDP